MSTKLITLDVNKTLLRVIGGVGRQYAKVASLYDIRVDPTKIEDAFFSLRSEHRSKYPNYRANNANSRCVIKPERRPIVHPMKNLRYERNVGEMTSVEWWTALIKKCFQEFGEEDSEKLTRLSYHIYLHFSTSNAWEVLPEVEELLKFIKSKNIKLGIISNLDDRLDTILASVDLLHYFDFTLSSETFGREKRHPDIYNEALKLANVSAEDALHVGANKENDYKGPRFVGMNSILISDQESGEDKTVDNKYVVSNLSEIKSFLK